MHLDVGRVPAAVSASRQRIQVLEHRQRAALFVEAMRGCCVPLLIDDVYRVAVVRETEMARPCVVVGRHHLSRFVRRKLAALVVEAKLAGLVIRADMRHEDEALGSVQLNAVSLDAGVDPLYELADRSVVAKPVDSYAAAP